MSDHKIKPSAEGLASVHQVHHQRRTIFEEEGDQSVEKDCQFGCLNFSYKSGVVSPVTAYQNKWPSDWQQHWFYYMVNPPSPGGSHPLTIKELPPLHESYAKNPSCPEGDEFVMMLRRFTRKYSTRDIVEEYRNILVCPLVDGWAVADDEWADDIRGIPCPDWTKVFGFTLDRELYCVLRWISSFCYVSDA
jgi:hypothetical protein